MTCYEDLPLNAQIYLDRMEKLCGVPVSWIGVGPDRDDMFLMPRYRK